jgi:hypothetical protein
MACNPSAAIKILSFDFASITKIDKKFRARKKAIIIDNVWMLSLVERKGIMLRQFPEHVFFLICLRGRRFKCEPFGEGKMNT